MTNRVRLTPELSSPQRSLSATTGSPLSGLQDVYRGVLENWDEIARELNLETTKARPVAPVQEEARPKKSEGEDPEKRDADKLTELTKSREDRDAKKVVAAQGSGGQNGGEQQRDEQPRREPAPPQTEAAQALASLRQPELPADNPAVAAGSWPVPNHSAGASGFGSTWSVAASRNSPEDIILSE